MMDKRLNRLVESGLIPDGVSCLDTYDMKARQDWVHTLRTNVNTARQTFIAINNKDNTMDNKENHVIFKGKEIRDGDGTYCNDSLKFHKKGLRGLSRTLKAHKADAGVCDGLKIRKLTPKECFRLMGVSDEDSDKMAKAGISDSQRYKLAGNSIVVNVLERIFENMFIGKAEEAAEAEGVTEKASDFEVKKEALIELIASMSECSTGNEPQILAALSELLAARRSA